MWPLGTWFSRRLGSAGLVVGLKNLKGLFQFKQIYDKDEALRFSGLNPVLF